MNDEPLLSLDETDALLEAMRSGADEEQDLESADLGSPDRALRGALGKADRVAERMANALRRLLLRAHGITAEAEENPPEIVPYSVLSGAIQPASAISMLTTPGQSTAMLILGPQLTAFVCERRLGASAEGDDENAAGATPRSELTAVDRRVVQGFVNDVTEEFSKAWNGQPKAITPSAVLARVADIPPLSQFEPMLRIGIRLAPTGGPADEAVIALTAGAARSGMSQDSHDDTHVTSPEDQQLMALRVGAASVNIASMLGTVHTNVAGLLDLKEGDILRLSTVPGDPLDVKVNGVVKLRGTPAVTHGNLSIEIKEVL